MKLPNWLHRKPAEDYDTDRFDSFASALEAENDALYGGPLRAEYRLDGRPDYVTHYPQPDPYLDSPTATPTFAVGATAPELASLKERWDKADKALFPAPPESVEGAHTRGYWEGRSEADKASLFPEYRVEVIRDADTIDTFGVTINEVLLYDATRCLVHLERIDTDHWWLTLSPTGTYEGETTFDLFRVKKRVEVTEQ